VGNPPLNFPATCFFIYLLDHNNVYDGKDPKVKKVAVIGLYIIKSKNMLKGSS